MDEAEAELRTEVRAGRLDERAVQAVLTAAGHRVPRVRRDAAGGLTERELEVLRLLARGLTIREMATRLVVAEKTIDNHIQHIYAKIGVSTRAGATLHAMERNLLDL
jgi:DNA-binding NarL/FixJ family response regulator